MLFVHALSAAVIKSAWITKSLDIVSAGKRGPGLWHLPLYGVCRLGWVMNVLRSNCFTVTSHERYGVSKYRQIDSFFQQLFQANNTKNQCYTLPIGGKRQPTGAAFPCKWRLQYGGSCWLGAYLAPGHVQPPYNDVGRSTLIHYSDVIMSAMASQITGDSIIYPTVCSGEDQRKHQSSAPLWGVFTGHRRIPRSKGQ